MRAKLQYLEVPGLLLCGILGGFLLWGQDNLRTWLGTLSTRESKAYDLDDFAAFPTWGAADAPLTLIEFGDYECPYCQQWRAEVWPELEAAYGQELQYIFVDFPLTDIHPEAFAAAEAAHCAREQDAYWAYHEGLLTGARLNEARYQALAQELGLDLAWFSACMEDGRYQERVLEGRALAVQYGFTSTPAFLVNGTPVVGAQDFGVFQDMLGAAR
jgi:protein-disulfide isomerase